MCALRRRRDSINTAGAADGSIIAAIIVTQIPMNQPNAPEIRAGAGVHPAHPLHGHDPRHERDTQQRGAQRRASTEAQPVHENGAAWPFLPTPSSSIPNARTFERVARAAVSVELTGCGTPVSRVGSVAPAGT